MNLFTRTCLEVFSPLGIDIQALESSVEDALAEDLADVLKSDDIRQYQNEFPLADAALSDYCNKLIRVADSGEIMTGLRFQDSRGGRPVIDVLYASFPLDVDGTLPAIRDAIVNRYHTASPECISAFVPGAMRSTSSDFARPAKALYAANLNQPFPRHRHPELSIRQAMDTGFYKRYLEEYRAFNDGSARNRLVSQPETFEDLAALVANGTLFEITIGGQWAGVIAYDYLRVLSVPGFEIVEEFIIARFRGQGFGKYAQSMLIGHMQVHNRQGAQFMFGTIHSENTASIRTAEANGRMLLGAWYEMGFRRDLA